MQKYWHKGAFFQDNPDETRGTTHTHEISLRDFSAPTGEDRVDKTTLPKVMQVRLHCTCKQFIYQIVLFSSEFNALESLVLLPDALLLGLVPINN